LPLRGERGIHTHTLYNVYELRVLLNRFERLKKIHKHLCVCVYTHKNVITTGKYVNVNIFLMVAQIYGKIVSVNLFHLFKKKK